MKKRFFKETDVKAREWLDANFVPKQNIRVAWTENQFEWNDANITSSTDEEYYLELKVRHVKSTDYSGLTAIEQDKFNTLLKHKGKVALMVMFKDCICWFPPTKLFDAFAGIGLLPNCPDETHPTTTKEWVLKNKVVGYFDTTKAIKYNYASM